MQEVRVGLLQGIDVTIFPTFGQYNNSEIRQLVFALKDKIDIEKIKKYMLPYKNQM